MDIMKPDAAKVPREKVKLSDDEMAEIKRRMKEPTAPLKDIEEVIVQRGALTADDLLEEPGNVTVMEHPPVDARKIVLITVADVRIEGAKIRKALEEGATVLALDLAVKLQNRVLRELKTRQDTWLIEETLIATRDPSTDATLKA